MGFSSSSHEPPEGHKEGVSFQTVEDVDVYCSGGEAFEYYSPFLLTAPTRSDSIRTEAVHASGVKGGLEKLHF